MFCSIVLSESYIFKKQKYCLCQEALQEGFLAFSHLAEHVWQVASPDAFMAMDLVA